MSFSAARPGAPVHNWAGTRSWRPARVVRPGSLAEAVDQVAAHAEAGHRLTPAGSRHSFSDAAVTADVQIELSRLRGVVEAEPGTDRVTFWAGTLIHDVVRLLGELGLALDSMGDIDGQTLGGALATGTHGTGVSHTGYAGAVTGLQVVTADGQVRWLNDDDAEFDAARVCLGALGLITQVQLQCVAAFRLHCVQHQEPAEQVLESFAERAERLDHPEFFWFPAAPVITVKTSTRVPQDTAARRRHPWVRFAGEHLADNLGLELISRLATLAPSTTPALNRFAAAAMSTRDEVEDSHRVFVSPRTVRFREMEYALDLDRSQEVFDGVREVFDRLGRAGHHLSFPLEVRVGAPEDAWMSPAYGRRTLYVAVHQYHRQPAEPVFAPLEELFLGLEGRPHWGKVNTLTAERAGAIHPRLEDFRVVRQRLDPQQVFTNPSVQRVLG